jgi:hypothetical protein
MTGEPGATGAPDTSTDEQPDLRLHDPHVLAWFGEHLPQLRRSAVGPRFLYWSLAVGFVVGLAAHVGGYLLRPSPPSEPLGLVADLVHALGLALWTGVVVAVFVQVFPEGKRRQLKQALAAYEAALRDPARTAGDQVAGDEAGPTAGQPPGR